MDKIFHSRWNKPWVYRCSDLTNVLSGPCGGRCRQIQRLKADHAEELARVTAERDRLLAREVAD